MEGEVKGKTFKMKGHTLPGINQRLDATATNVAEQGLAGSSAFQQFEAMGAGFRAARTMRGRQGNMPGGGATGAPGIGAMGGGGLSNMAGIASAMFSKPSVVKIYAEKGKRKPNPEKY